MRYKSTIGLEIHAELKTNSKMFCSCKNDPFIEEVNVYICPVCTGQPGALPIANKEAIKNMIKIGIAVDGRIANYTEFDRKSYFYPDLPKGFQISQYEYPIVSGGEIAGIKLKRIHLEEDTAKLIHEGDYSLVNFNRSGVPLMELVTEPEIHNAQKALEFAKELQLILRTLGVSDADMEKGQMRIEANVSVSDTDKLGTKVELKNINSFKAVEKAIEYEIKRQINILENGGKIVQETRGWDENKEITFSQRKKEKEQEYRYFPEPDLAKIFINEIFDIDQIKCEMPELPKEKRKRLQELGIKKEYISVLVADSNLLDLFDKLADKVFDKVVLANVVVNNFAKFDTSILKDIATKIDILAITINSFIKREITNNVFKDLLEKIAADVENKLDIVSLINENKIDIDEEKLNDIIKEVINNNQNAVQEYISGKEKAIMFLVGQVMKKMKGKADPKDIISRIKSELST